MKGLRSPPLELQNEKDSDIFSEARIKQVYALADLYEAYDLFPSDLHKLQFLRVLLDSINEAKIDLQILLREELASEGGICRYTTIYKGEPLGRKLHQYQNYNKGRYPKRHEGYRPYLK